MTQEGWDVMGLLPRSYGLNEEVRRTEAPEPVRLRPWNREGIGVVLGVGGTVLVALWSKDLDEQEETCDIVGVGSQSFAGTQVDKATGTWRGTVAEEASAC